MDCFDFDVADDLYLWGEIFRKECVRINKVIIKLGWVASHSAITHSEKSEKKLDKSVVNEGDELEAPETGE